jgi:large subunit ribosomal protein L22
MEAVAKTKYLKGSPRKARLVIDLIRGENVSRALNILKFTEKRAAGPIAKCLNSAIANATYKAEQQNKAIDPDDLWVRSCFVDMGPTKNRRRMRPAPQGRAYREQRHYCHITIEVTNEVRPKTEEELLREQRIEAAKARRAAAPKKEKKKDTPKAEAAPEVAEDEAAENVEAAAAEEAVAVEEAAVETASEEVAEETAEETAAAEEEAATENSDAAESEGSAEAPAQENTEAAAEEEPAAEEEGEKQ